MAGHTPWKDIRLKTPDNDPLELAIAIIEGYQLELRNSDSTLTVDNLEDLQAGRTLAEVGFCQGSIFTHAIARIRALQAQETK